MATTRGQLAALGRVVLVMMCLAACSSAANSGSSSSAAASPAATPQLVSPKPLGGSAGTGPRVISSPSPLPGGNTSGQQLVLSDRALTITSVTSQRGSSQNFVVIELHLVVRNTGEKAIENQAAFFELIGAEGDAFGQQGNNNLDDFYGVIAPHASRSGTIEFDIPAAAGSDLYLRYRPEIATETVLTRLTIG